MKDPQPSSDEPAAAPQAWWHAPKRWALKIWDLACEHWFILGVGLAIGIAAAVPSFGKNGGWIRAEYTIKYGAVIIIFFLSGLSLKSKVLLQAAARAHLHLFIQLLCLGLTPLIGYGIYRAMDSAGWINTSLLSGLVVCTSMPTTVSTNVVFTQQAGGNQAVALINAVIGNIIGIFVSPGLLALYVSVSGQAPYSKVLSQLGITVIAPLAVGQVVQYAVPQAVAWLQQRVNFSKVSNIMIILLVWNTFSGTFAADISVGAGSMVVVLVVILLLYPFFTLACLGAATAITLVPWLQRWFKLTRADSVAVMMCGATKTLALGIPLISVLYADQKDIALLALPLIVYHAVQILQGNLLISPLKKWVEAGQNLPLVSELPPATKDTSANSSALSSSSSSSSPKDAPAATNDVAVPPPPTAGERQPEPAHAIVMPSDTNSASAAGTTTTQQAATHL